MKIICIDNFNRETVNDVLVCENVNECYGQSIIEFLNDKFSGVKSSDYFKLVNDNYILYKFEI